MKTIKDFSFEVLFLFLSTFCYDFDQIYDLTEKGFQHRWENRKARTDLRNLNSSLKRRLPYSDLKTQTVLFRRRVSTEKTLNDKPSTFYDC